MKKLGLIVLLFTSLNCALAKQVVVAVNHFPPWKIVSADGREFSGINIELIEQVISEYNKLFTPQLHISYVSCPLQRCLQLVKNGKADILTGMLRNKDREQYMYYLEPAYKNRSTKSFYVLKKSKNEIKRYTDLYGKVVGVVAGSKYFKRFDRDKKIIKMSSASGERNLSMLAKGRFDVLIGTETQMDYFIDQSEFGNLINKASYKFDKKTDVYFTLSKKSLHVGTIRKLNSIIHRLKRLGSFNKVMTRGLRK